MSPAVNIIAIPPDFFARARVQIQRARLVQYRAWRRQAETFQAVAGVRPTLVHVPDEVWRGSFADQVDAVSAVVAQMEACDD